MHHQLSGICVAIAVNVGEFSCNLVGLATSQAPGVMLVAVAASVAAFAGAVYIYARMSDSDNAKEAPRNAYIIENQVTHARILPTPSKHAFGYPTLAFLLSLDALESHSLNLARGWLFSYGGTSWRVTGLRSVAYLLPDSDASRPPRSIKEKLREVLKQHGCDAARMGDAWTLTMPSYMGYEGINPLTVHYCYTGTEKELTWVVFEIHNTFGEKYVHVCECGKGEDKDRQASFDHQWTFARDFHVSPFNDRLGHYTMAITAPPPPSSPTLASNPPLPKIRIHLHTASDAPNDSGTRTASIGPLKLTAMQSARRAVPLTSPNLLRALSQYPLALFLSFARILYHAWILHYAKRLDVFPRPDPKPAMRAWGSTQVHSADGTVRASGGVGWQDEGPLEAYSRRVVERFLARRAGELGISITLVSGDPAVSPQTFSPSASRLQQDANAAEPAHDAKELVIHYAAPRFFSTLLLAPSVAHMLLLGRAEKLFQASSEPLFTSVFAASPTSSHISSTQWLRTSLLPRRFLLSATDSALPPPIHPLDVGAGLSNALALSLLHMADVLEKIAYNIARARFIPGLEPWRRWERAADASQDA